VFAEVFLPLRVQRRVTAVAEEQVELNLVVPLAVEKELVVGRPIRADEFGVLDSVRVLPLGGFVANQTANGVALLLAVRLFPVRLDRLPEVVV